MDNKLKDLIAAGDASLERILDGVHHVKDTATGKVYEWADGPVGELAEAVDLVPKVVAPPAIVSKDLKSLAVKHGLGGFFK